VTGPFPTRAPDAPDDLDQRRSSSSSSYPASKRALDLVLGGIGLVAALPILAAIRVAMIASGDRGPFLYRAPRVGEGGRSIEVLKVRTMRIGDSGPMVTIRGDTRITSVGQMLRATKLDELPQLWNVLRGDMALVGPRPEDPSYVDLHDPLHRIVFMARPGITGLAQLAYRNEADLLTGSDLDRMYREEILPAKLRLDAEYLANRSVRLDLAIISRTVGAVLRRSDAAPTSTTHE